MSDKLNPSAPQYPAVSHSTENPLEVANHPDDVKYWCYPEHSGWLLSQAKYLKDWRKRFYVLKQGFLYKLPSADLDPQTKYKLAWNLKECLDISIPPVDESKGPTFHMIMKNGYNATGRVPTIETIVLVAESQEERNKWYGTLVAAKARCQFQPQVYDTAVGLPSGPASLTPGHAADLYGESIAKQLEKLRLDLTDIKENVSTILDEQANLEDTVVDNADAVMDHIDRTKYGGRRKDSYGDCLSPIDDDFSDSDIGYGSDGGYGFDEEGVVKPSAYTSEPVIKPVPAGTTLPFPRCKGVHNIWPDEDWEFDPNNLCGRRIRIFWKAGEQRIQYRGNTRSTQKDQWWAGVVTLVNKKRNLHQIQYDDGELECLNLGMNGTLHSLNRLNFGPKDIGRRVEVYWKHEERHVLLSSKSGSTKRWCNNPNGKWYAGVISESRWHRFAAPHPKLELENKFVSDAAVIKYDDGDVELLDLNLHEYRYISGPRIWEGQRISLVNKAKAKWEDCTVISDPVDGQTEIQVVCADGRMERVDLAAAGNLWQMREKDVKPYSEAPPAGSSGNGINVEWN